MTPHKPDTDKLAERCRAFIERQACGEWYEETIAADAQKLLTFVEQEIASARVRELEAELSDQRTIAKYNREQAEAAERKLAEAYERAAMAVADEHLTDNTGTSDDIAYDTAIDHAVNAIRKLAQEVKHEAE